MESCTSAHGNRMTATTRVERACRRLPPGGGTQSMSFNRALCVCVCVCVCVWACVSVCVGVCECVPPSSTASLLPELLWITVRPSPTSRSTRPPCTDHWYREIVQLAINCQTNLLHKLVKQMVKSISTSGNPLQLCLPCGLVHQGTRASSRGCVIPHSCEDPPLKGV